MTIKTELEGGWDVTVSWSWNLLLSSGIEAGYVVRVRSRDDNWVFTASAHDRPTLSTVHPSNWQKAQPPSKRPGYSRARNAAHRTIREARGRVAHISTLDRMRQHREVLVRDIHAHLEQDSKLEAWLAVGALAYRVAKIRQLDAVFAALQWEAA